MAASNNGRSIRPWLVTLWLAGTSTAVLAAEHPLSDIATVALRAMEARAEAQHYTDLEVQVRPLDARLGLSQCGQPLRILPDASQRALGPVSVGVRCDGPTPWTLYVRGQVSAGVSVPVLATSIPRGDIIGRSDIELQNRRITQEIGSIVSEMDDIIGKEARRDLAPGNLLNFSDLRSPELVKRGALVTLISGVSGLRVSMQGKAMSNGAAGDRILVTNLSSGKRVEGVIAQDGSVVMQ